MAGLLIDNLIKEIQEEFGKELVITSNTRTPLSQAKAMYNHCEAKYNQNAHNLTSYAAYKKPWVDAIYGAFKQGKDNKETHEQVIKRMETVIQSQMNQGNYISNHLLNTARDIQTKHFSKEELSTLKTLINKHQELFLNDETRTKQPHFHLHLK
ncbi:hypothetical protein P1X15_29725 [Runella sp. MFBS21]|uniref:hypothetical protein n=1 Tax=Runella sp. MFBS21 TaxID=3034018 RepID=UPI0023F94F9D|nr:hypothetical protein [Runella sp. MFBS21]MDF7821832.1 hypothetical protein [Runella sp. MFBS21]